MKRIIKDFDPKTLREREIGGSAENTEDGHVKTLQERIKGMRERLGERKTERERIQENQNPGGEDVEDYEEDDKDD